MLCPVIDRNLLEYLRATVLGAYLRDTDRATVLGRAGDYTAAAANDGTARFNAQDFLLARYNTDYG